MCAVQCGAESQEEDGQDDNHREFMARALFPELQKDVRRHGTELLGLPISALDDQIDEKEKKIKEQERKWSKRLARSESKLKHAEDHVLEMKQAEESCCKRVRAVAMYCRCAGQGDDDDEYTSIDREEGVALP